MKRISVDRSRILQYQRCPRKRYYEYHAEGMGIVTKSKPLPLAVGGAVHEGLAILLREGQKFIWDTEGQLIVRTGAAPATYMEAIALLFKGIAHTYTVPHVSNSIVGSPIRRIEELAVAAALADFATHSALEIDTTELAAMGKPRSDEGESIAKALGLAEDDPQVLALRSQVAQNFNAFDAYLKKEQTALVEALVRAYARRRLRPLLEQFEVLEVEREGTWQLGALGDHEHIDGGALQTYPHAEIVFMSRPDALLRERESNELYLISFKTAATWDVRKARDAEHDMQGLSEGVEIEKRLGEWWNVLHMGASRDKSPLERLLWKDLGIAMETFLRGLSTPPRIFAIRYEYLLKGQRRMDRELTSALGMECRSQGSHLVRGLLNSGMAAGDEKWCWSWDFKKEDGSASKLHYKSWKGAAIWEHMAIAKWIDLLDEAVIAMSGEDATSGLTPRELGYSCSVQLGFTPEHPLDSVFLPPVVVYRNDDDLRDWIDSTEAQEVRIAEALVQISLADVAEDVGLVRHLLNVHFPMHRQACEYPSTCAYVRICYGSEDIRSAPLESGVYEPRVANHPQEVGAVE